MNEFSRAQNVKKWETFYDIMLPAAEEVKSRNLKKLNIHPVLKVFVRVYACVHCTMCLYICMFLFFQCMVGRRG